jgi:hypothetical protein
MEFESAEKRKEMLDKVAKLLALASSPNEHEAALAASRAQEILMKYNLSVYEVSSLEESPKPGHEEFMATNQRWARILLNELSKLHDCRSFSSGVDREGKPITIMVGHAQNIEVVKAIFAYLVPQITLLGIDAVVQTKLKHSQVDHWQESFCEGCVGRIIERIKEYRDLLLSQDVHCKALVVRMAQETNDYIRRNFGPIGWTANHGLNPSAYRQGQSAANSINIYPSVGGSGPKMIR